jgi:purine-binding chemotaxis protein CheW
MRQKEDLEAGLVSLFAAESTGHTDAEQSDTTDENQAEPASTETERLSQPPATDSPVADVADDVLNAHPAGHSFRPAAQAVSPSAGVPAVHLVVFALGDEQYGVGIASVDSIIRPRPITAVPRAPDFVEGVTNLRGTVLPVIDLHRRFGLPTQDITRDARIIVAESGGNKVGMMVDAVLEVRRVSEATIEPPSPLVSTVDSAFVTGIAKVEDERLIILLDLEQVLAHQ